MNIGLDIRELQPDVMTGIGRYLVNFLHWAIPAHPDCCFYLYGNQKTHFDYPEDNVTLRIIPERFTMWWDQISLPYQIKQDGLDVFLSPYIKGPLFSSAPLVTTIHDLLFLALPEYKKNGLWETYYKYFARLAATRASAIITGSLFSQKDIIRLLKTDKGKIQVIPLSVAERYYQQLSPDTLTRIGQQFGIGERYILYVGNFKPHKNVLRLVRAYALLETSLKDDYKLVLCGKRDKYTQEIDNLIQSLGLGERVILTGMVADTDLPALYNGATLFVFPSLYEGFGIPLIEAMASSTAVISSDVTSLPEVAGDSALLVDPRDTAAIAEAINLLLTNPALRGEYITKGLERAQQFHADKSGTMIFELLTRIIHEKDQNLE